MKPLRTKPVTDSRKGISVMTKEDLPCGTRSDKQGNSLLFYQWEPKLYEWLIRTGARTEDRMYLPGIHGATPLHCMALGAHPDLLRLLLKYGVCPNTRDDKGSTPLGYLYNHKVERDQRENGVHKPAEFFEPKELARCIELLLLYDGECIYKHKRYKKQDVGKYMARLRRPKV